MLMEEKNIDIFIRICNNKGMKYGIKAIVNSNCIKDMKLFNKFYIVYMQLNTKRKRHNNFEDELNDCLNDINCCILKNGLICRKDSGLNG